jgi:hypothetical protein
MRNAYSIQVEKYEMQSSLKRPCRSYNANLNFFTGVLIGFMWLRIVTRDMLL